MQDVSKEMLGREIFTLDKNTYKVKSFILASFTETTSKDGKTTYLNEGAPSWECHEISKCFTSRKELLDYVMG